MSRPSALPTRRATHAAATLATLALAACGGADSPTAPAGGTPAGGTPGTPAAPTVVVDSITLLPLADARARLTTHIADAAARAVTEAAFERLDTALRAGRRAEARTALLDAHAAVARLDALDATRAADHAALGLSLLGAAAALDVTLP